MLVQERMAHIEELRLIHADINIVCYSFSKQTKITDYFRIDKFINRWKQQ